DRSRAVDVGDVVEGELADEDATIDDRVEDPLKNEPLHRLPQRPAGDLEPLGEVGLAELRARWQLAGHHRGAELLREVLDGRLPPRRAQITQGHGPAFV